MANFTLSPSARADLEAIAVYVGEAAGNDVAEQVLERIREKCRSLAKAPGRLGTPRDEIGEGIRSFPVSPHVLFFRGVEENLEIVRVLHERQDVSRQFEI